MVLILVALSAFGQKHQHRLQSKAPGSNLRTSDTSSLDAKPLFLLPLFFDNPHPLRADFFLMKTVADRPLFPLASSNAIDLFSPWREEVDKQKEFHPWQIIVGTIGAGGAAYVAYQHIRKYGIF